MMFIYIRTSTNFDYCYAEFLSLLQINFSQTSQLYIWNIPFHYPDKLNRNSAYDIA